MLVDIGIVFLMLKMTPASQQDWISHFATWGGHPAVVSSVAIVSAVALLWVACTGSAFRRVTRAALRVLAGAIVLTAAAAAALVLIAIGFAILCAVALMFFAALFSGMANS